MQFPSKVIEELKYYVYVYINPMTGKIFYVGKGKGNRAFDHLDDTSESNKVAMIKEIQKQGREPQIEILVHGLEDESVALKIESAIIDTLGLQNLTNAVSGWGSNIVGRMGIKEIISLYDSKPVNKIDEPVLLIRINRLYRYGMTPEELYEATRGVWKLGERRFQVKYVFAVYRGIVREVYKVAKWFDAGATEYKTRPLEDVQVPGRYEFTKLITEEEIRAKYIDKSVADIFPDNSQNPITYVNC
jgi:uncharacterized protein